MLRRDLLWALDPVRFAREALGFHPDSSQSRVLRSTGLRLLLNCTRQWGKSTTAAALALHRALYYPHSLILLASPSQRQSGELFAKIDVFMKTLAVMPIKLKGTNIRCSWGMARESWRSRAKKKRSVGSVA
jgi:hypothetical protein